MSATLSNLSHSSQAKLNQLFSSRLRLVLLTLVIEILIMIPLMRSFLLIVGIFNVPAIMALVSCAFKRNLLDCQTQKTTKTLLKVGVAKAIGGVLLAVYIGLKYFLILNETANGNKAIMKLYAIYLGGSAVVDILYSMFALMAIKKTKDIINILKRKRSHSKELHAYTMISSKESSISGSTSCSEEDGLEKGSQNSI